MKPVVTADEMRALDRATIDELGIPALTLMETAGRAVADAASAILAGAALGANKGTVAVVCGPGNNGGDGFVVARVLRDRGVDATVYLAVARDQIRGDAGEHLHILERAGGVVRAIAAPAQLDEQRDAIGGAALAVDALFGVGLSRPVTGHLADVVAAINAAPRRLAVDIPSGLDTDTGRSLGAVVDAHVTVTMAARKVALVGAPGFARAGEVIVAEIGIPPGLISQTARAGLVEASDVARALPSTKQLDHKGTRGHVLVIGGTHGMRGAGRLAAAAALRAGAGLCTLASDGDFDAADSIMTRSLSSGLDALSKALDGKAAIAIGPGLGQSKDAAAWVAEVLASETPAVLDADALNLHAGKLDVLAAAAGPLVLTPHPGEAARLLGIETKDVEADRLAAARKLAAETRAVVVLKGARTIVCDGTLGDDHCSINPTGGPALGTGGSGDVLAGTIAALLAQKLSPGDAARAGVWVHGAAGDALAKVHGDRGVVSSDLPDAIARAIADLISARDR